MPLNSHLSTSTQIILVWRKGSTPTNTFYFFSDRTQPNVFFRKEYHAPRVLRKFHRNRISESKVLCHFMRLPPSLRLGGNFICIPVEWRTSSICYDSTYYFSHFTQITYEVTVSLAISVPGRLTFFCYFLMKNINKVVCFTCNLIGMWGNFFLSLRFHDFSNIVSYKRRFK